MTTNILIQDCGSGSLLSFQWTQHFEKYHMNKFKCIYLFVYLIFLKVSFRDVKTGSFVQLFLTFYASKFLNKGYSSVFLCK